MDCGRVLFEDVSVGCRDVDPFVCDGGGPPKTFSHIKPSTLPGAAYVLEDVLGRHAYELQVTRICDTGKQYIDLAHGEHTLQATTDDVLDGEGLRLVDLLLGVEDTQKTFFVSQCTLLLPKPSERSSAPEVLGLALVVLGMQSESLAAQ